MFWCKRICVSYGTTSLGYHIASKICTGELAPFLCEMHLRFCFELIPLINFIFLDNCKTTTDRGYSFRTYRAYVCVSGGKECLFWKMTCKYHMNDTLLKNPIMGRGIATIPRTSNIERDVTIVTAFGINFVAKFLI